MILFLFPHQDDEAPVFHEIEELTRTRQALSIVYLTTGQASTAPCERRNEESLGVLDKLGVDKDQIHFIGGQLGVPDGQLQKHLERLHFALVRLLEGHTVKGIIMPAWEGGHQDHDAAHLLGFALARQWTCVEHSAQFPYYQGQGLRGALFRTLAPLPGNGPVKSARIGITKRLKYLSLLLQYTSQMRTWLGLGPFFVLHYLLKGTQVLQPLSEERLNTRPHKGPLLYERRGFCTYERMRSESASFRSNHLI